MRDLVTYDNSWGILVACMPKSGSTFLSSLIASMPGFRREHLVPGYERREQELCLKAVERAYATTQSLRRYYNDGGLASEHRPKGFVAQVHVRGTQPTCDIIEHYQLAPIVLVRNIFDIIVSLRDHFERESTFMTMAYVDDDMAKWPPEKMYEFLCKMTVPWYINFYVNWYRKEHKLLITYEELTQDPRKTLQEVLKFAKAPRKAELLDEAMAAVASKSTRKNKGVAGRGQVISDELQEYVRDLCRFYDDVDFTPMGIDVR